MNPWIFWPEVVIVVAILYGVILLIDSIYAAGTGKSKLWFRQDIDDPPEIKCPKCNEQILTIFNMKNEFYCDNCCIFFEKEEK